MRDKGNTELGKYHDLLDQ